MKKADRPCDEFRSRHPGESNHSPDPCKRCGYSYNDHGDARVAKRIEALERENAALRTALIDVILEYVRLPLV